jgi:putative serine protease PepD
MDAEEPADRPLLPPDDRVWRHPAEVAMEARAVAVRRRPRRGRTATVLTGAAAAAGLMWLSQAGPTGVPVTADIIPLATTGDSAVLASTAPTTSLIATSGVAGSDLLTVRSTDGTETLAGALALRDGFVITSGRALDGIGEVSVVWGDRTESGVVIGYDEVTDVSVVRIDAYAHDSDRAAARELTEGDVVTLVDPNSADDAYRVVSTSSSSARVDGEPVVGIVELDSTLGAVPPGSPAFDSDGAIIGMITATADDAPVAVVPIDLVRVVADEIINLGAATHPRLGARARSPLDTDPTDLAGSLVISVTVGGPAATGGIQAGDLIVEIDDTPIDSMEAMVAALRSHEPGDAVRVVVTRDGRPILCSVELGSALDDAA